ncbi:DNA-binding transcriptional regulator, MarR family [Roseomonas rosea]|uniref:DNA-binding transcriptional regulator, MarR family n=1 Tax=Muricoccus roseus TaxID=198092 RepID=A0A1M6P600_9PROT|nr:MarR family transcriptional regulator [Roseomonas rosea]SHK03348.1 DNA-binding transcriptional regulator, MarR family [Roseomonas rosea]
MAQPTRATPARARTSKPRAEQPTLRVLPGGLASVRLGPLQDMLGFQLRLAQEASFAGFARRTGDSGLKPGHFAALLVIHENPGLSQTALGAAVGRDKSTLTPKLTELERRGLIRRDRAAADRRSYALRLTPEGEEALAELQRHATAHDAALDRLVGPENRQAFLETLRRLIAGLDSDDT